MTYYWTFWLWAAIPISFGVAEAYALSTNHETLSRYIWNLTYEWPPFPWFAGFATGFLVCHFFWGGIVAFAPVTVKKVDPEA